MPFSSVNLGIPNSNDAALICEIFLREYEKGLGKGEQPIFPNIIFRVKKELIGSKMILITIYLKLHVKLHQRE